MKKVNIEEYKKDGQIDYERLLNKTFVVETDESALKKFGFETDEKAIVKEYTLLDFHILENKNLFLKVKDLNKDILWMSVDRIGKLLFVYEKEDKPEPPKETTPVDEWKKWQEILEKLPKTTPAPWERDKLPPCPPYNPWKPNNPWPEHEQPWKTPRGPGYWPDYVTTCDGCGQNFNSNEAIGYVCGNSHCPMGLGGVFCGLTITR